MYKVLVLDDEKYIRKAIINLVDWNSCDAEVMGEAANGEEALCLMENEKPDIVLVDIRMKGMDGLEFIEKAKERYSKVSYIILTAYGDFKYAQKAVKLGVEDYILKPVCEEDVENILKKIIHKKREEWLQIQAHRQETEWISEKEIKYRLPGKRVAAAAFYLSDEKDGQEVETSVRTYIEKLQGSVSAYMIHDLKECMICVINGESVEEIDVVKLIHFVWNETSQLKHRAAYSPVCDRKNVLNAVRQAEDILKTGGNQPKEGSAVGETKVQNSIDDIKDYINKHFAERLSASEIGEHFHYSPAYLSALFKEQAGINLTAYIENVRMEWAKYYMDTGALSITDIALKTGYSDISYFSKVFKKYTGMSPREYKKESCHSIDE